ncbi:MAG TPA: sugar ABC transporter substrate-binding protein [Acetobacteraceae bacterium]|nr:sugar ABC transporter substrate-binding protein [Acetobacteraceae bacterium]
MKRIAGWLGAVLASGVIWCLGAGTVAAQGNTAEQLLAQWNKDVVGKTIVYIPVTYNAPLTRIWGQRMEMIAKRLGIKFEIRDPNFDTQREEQLLEAEINQHPDLLIVHNPNVQVLASAIQRAEQAGIYVVQINMASRYKSDAFVGVQPNELGSDMAQAVVEACGGPGSSHKIALMDGEVTSAYSIGIMQGAMSVFKQHPDIQVVSNQAANWDTKIAHDKAATVLQAHPDLCAYMGWWSGQDSGIAQAVRQAGLLGKVKIFTTDGGEPPACDYLKQGLFYEDFIYQATLQADQMMAVSEMLLQSGAKPGTFHIAAYTPITPTTAKNVTPTSCTPVSMK